MKDYWNISVFLSLLIHFFVLVVIPSLNIFFIKTKKSSQTYQLNNIQLIRQETERTYSKNNLVEELIDNPPPPYLDDLFSSFSVNDEKILLKPNIVENTEREIIFSEFLNADLKKIPKYMDYYQKIRAKISKNLHHNYTGEDIGNISLSFIVLKDGSVKSIDFKTQLNDKEILKKIVLKSIYESAPFPPFPDELEDRVSLPFSINIQFRGR